MGFLAVIKRLLGDDTTGLDEENRRHLAAAWDHEHVMEVQPDTEYGSSRYDREMWIKKVRHMLEERLPVDEQTWQGLLADAHALGFDQAWIDNQLQHAFTRLVRKAVSDGVVTHDEHHTIELARLQIGLTEGEAEAVLQKVVQQVQAHLNRGQDASLSQEE